MDFGLIGHPLGHSFSKEIHESLDRYSYEICDLKEEDFDAFMTSKSFRAINVTIPYKQAVIPYLYEIDETAREIGAVNTVINRNGRLYGYNTDLFGISKLILRTADTVDGKSVLILGSGGTSKTAAFAAKKLGAEKIYKATRKENAEPDSLFEYVSYKNLPKDVEIIINTTPVGMFPNTDAMPIDPAEFEKLSAVIDVVYNPLRTKLVLSAEKKKISANGGLYMLVAQAVKAAELFTDEEFSDGTTDEIFGKITENKQNTVLIGMPGCGKTTVGKILAKKTGKEFIDTDALIEKEFGHPSEIIRKKGEEYFRDIESEVIDGIKNERGKIIAIGGGGVLREKNVDALKHNGVTVFIDRDISDVCPTDDRPLSSDREKLQKLYTVRYPIYISAADVTVVSDNDPENVAEMILKELKI